MQYSKFTFDPALFDRVVKVATRASTSDAGDELVALAAILNDSDLLSGELARYYMLTFWKCVERPAVSAEDNR